MNVTSRSMFSKHSVETGKYPLRPYICLSLNYLPVLDSNPLSRLEFFQYSHGHRIVTSHRAQKVSESCDQSMVTASASMYVLTTFI